MKSQKKIIKPIKNETELLSRAREIEGLSFSQLADRLHLKIPDTASKSCSKVSSLHLHLEPEMQIIRI